MRLLLIGLAAGFFGALFGVGGGIVMVPLLIIVFAYPERTAMGTSLVAIGVISIEGVVFYGLHGDIKPGSAALIGFPAAVGALFGTALQQRLRDRTLSYCFAALLVAVGVRLLI